MRPARVADPATGSGETAALLTAIAGLAGALDALPAPESTEFPAALMDAVGAHVPRIHQAYDDCVARILITEGRKTTCAKACSACCRHFVSSVEPFEILALDAHLKKRPDYAGVIYSTYRKSTVYESILARELEAGDEEEADDRATYRYFLKGIPCTFLMADGSCGIYAYRPMACRMFFAESSPRFCAGKAIASPWNRNFQVEMPQEVEEALARCSRKLEHLGLPEGLFPGLVAANALLGRYDASPASPPPSSSLPPPPTKG